MRIAIDCRYYNQSGIGNYLSGILENIIKTKNEIILIGDYAKLKHYHLKVIHTTNNPLSLKGLFLPEFKADVFFTPYYFIPFRLNMNIYCVIHDVVFLDLKCTNKNIIDLFLKKILIKRALRKSKKIFTVSRFSYNRISHYYKTNKLVIAYPGTSAKVKSFNNWEPKEDYLIFVGNIKKNKGLKTLILANNLLLNEGFKVKIKIVGLKDHFRSNEKIKDVSSNIEFTGYVEEDALLTLISKARYLIQPSLYEGFGLPPLEALYLRTKPILSDIEVFKEVYGSSDVIFFKNGDAYSLKEAIMENFNKEYSIDKIPAFDYKDTTNIILKEFTR